MHEPLQTRRLVTRLLRLGSAIRNVMQSRIARWIGVGLGMAMFGLLCANLFNGTNRDALSVVRPSSIFLALLGFASFHAFAIVGLTLLGGERASRLWAASQLAKYLPAPGASFAAMIHSSIAAGSSTRTAVKLTVRHSGLLLAGAVITGSGSMGWLVQHSLDLPLWSGVAVALLVGGVLLATVTPHVDAKTRALAAIAGVLAWVVLGALLGLAFGTDAPGFWAVAAGFPAAWSIGFIVLPIPAGVGVREAVLVLLLTPWLGHAGAVAFALLSRLVQTASDGILAIAVLGIRPLSRSFRERATR